MTMNQFIEFLAICAENVGMEISPKQAAELADKYCEKYGERTQDMFKLMDYLEGIKNET